MANAKEVTVGVLFFGALIALGLLTFLLSDINLFKETWDYTIYFDEANDLKIKDDVLIMGTHQGKVMEIEFREQPLWCDALVCELWVKVEVKMDKPLTLKEDYEISIRNANLLGGKVLDIHLGKSTKTIQPYTTTLVGMAIRDPVEAVSKFIETNKAPVRNTLRNIDNLVSNVSEWSDHISQGKGTVGRLIKSEKMANQVEAILADVKKLTSDLNRDDSLLAMITRDPATRDKVSKGLDDFSLILDGVASGEGTVGKLLKDSALHDQALAAITDLKSIVARVNQGKGLVGKLLAEESGQTFEDLAVVMTNAKAISSDLMEIVRHVREGEGPLGMILKDEAVAKKLGEVVDKASLLLDAALGSLEDAREAAPLVSLGSFLFGAL